MGICSSTLMTKRAGTIRCFTSRSCCELRAVAQAEATLRAGFTSARDLGTEGAGYVDVGLKAAIDQGIVPGPRLRVATRAIVALGAYGPKGFEPGVVMPQGPTHPAMRAGYAWATGSAP